MKIDNPIFTVNVSDAVDITQRPLSNQLKVTLREACKKCIESTVVGSTEQDIINASQALAIAHRIALSQYITGLKIQKFANSASINDTITLENEINLFIKEFNKATK
jgi:hypothetical protein